MSAGVGSQYYSAFNPLDIGGCALWLDAADQSTLTLSGSNVTQWRDKGSNTYTFSQGTTSSQPTRGTDLIGGIPVVSYTSGQSMRTTSYVQNSSTATFFVVTKVVTASFADWQFMRFFMNATTGYPYFYIEKNATYGKYAAVFSAYNRGGMLADIGSGSLAGVPRMFTAYISGSSGTSFINQNGSGTSLLLNNITGGFSTGITNGTIDILGGADGQMAEMIMFDRLLSTSEYQLVEGYLSRKWFRSGMPTTIVPFSPTQFTSCSLWLDAADSSTITLSGSNVTTWRDKSGNGTNASQATTSNQPVYQTNSINGLPSIQFPAIARNNLVCFDTGAFDFGTSARSAFFVIRNNYVSGTPGSSPHWFWPKTGNGTNALSLTAWIGANVQGQASGASATYNRNQNILVGYRFGSTSAFEELFSNGTSVATATKTTGGSSYANATSGYRIGGLDNADVGSSTYWFDGNIGEIILFNRALTTSERQQIEYYLSQKWGLSGTYVQGTLPFAPTRISTCALWLDAADSNSMTLSGSNVTQWRDKTSTLIFSNYTGTPTISNSFRNGNSVLSLSSTASLNNTTLVWPNANYSVFVVAYLQSGIVNNWVRLLNGGGGAGDTYLFMGTSSNSTNYAVFTGSGSAWNDVTSNTPATSILQSWSILGMTVASSTLTPYLNGTAQNTKTGTTGAFTGLNIGGVYTASGTQYTGQCWTGYVGEVLVYNSVLTTLQRQQIEGYLAMKWGLSSSLPVSHPYSVATNVPSTHPYFSIVPVTRQFAPIDIPECALWLDAADPNSMTLSGSNVTQWRDKSGNARNFTASGTGATWISSSPGLTFTSNLYTSSYSAAVTNETMFVVVNYTTTGFFIGSSAAGGRELASLTDSNRFGIANATIAWGAFTPNNSAFSNTTYLVTSIVTNGSNTQLAINGSTSFASSNITAFSGGNTQLGREIASYQFQGTIYEVLAYSSVLSTTQRQQVEGYLAKKWGLIGSTSTIVPYAPTQPSACTLWLDAADSSTITLSGSNVTQWRDKSGSGFNASNTSNYPTFSNSNINFAVSNQLKLSPFIPAGTRNVTLAIVWKANTVSNASFQSIIENSPTFNTNYGGWWRFMTYQYGFGGRNADYYGLNEYGGNPTPLSNMPTFTAGSYNLSFITQYSTDGTNFTISNYHNGSLYGTQTYTGAIATATQGTMGLNANSESFNGSIAEVMLFLTQLTDTQRRQIEYYLSQKWGLSGTYTQGTLPFSPTQISTCQLWFDAADSNSMTLSGSNVTQWNDKSGNGRNTSSLTGTATLGTNSVNAKQGVYFNGTSYFTGSFSYSSNTLSWFVVGTMESDGESYGRLLSLGTSGQYDFDSALRINALARNATATELISYRGSQIASGMNITYGTPFVYSSVIDGTSNYPFLNGTAGTGAATSGNFGFTTYGISGSFGTNIQRNKGHIFEILIYSSALTTTQRQQVEGYLAAKWGLRTSLPSTHPYALTGLPSTHPYISRNPRVAVFNPRQISNCALWLDAADPSTLTLSGSNVIQWNDKSGTSNNAVLGSFGTGPTRTSSNTLLFTRTSSNAQYLRTQVGKQTTQAVTFAFVIRSVNDNPNGTIFDFRKTTNGIPLHTINTSNVVHRGSTSALVSFTYSFPTNLCVFVMQSTANTFQAYTNGTQVINSTATLDMPAADSLYSYIGATLDSAGYPNLLTYTSSSEYAEVLMFNGFLNTTQRQQVEGYLAWKWGLTGGYTPTLAPFTPTQPSTCVLWLDAADSSTITLSGSNVTTWRDKSGSGNNATQATTSNQPVYLNNSITYTGSNSLNLPNGTLPSGSTETTMFIVASVTNTSNVQYLFGAGSAVNNQAFNIYTDANTLNLDVYGTRARGSFTSTNTNILEFVFGSSTLTIFVNGTSNSSQGTVTKATGTSNNSIGASSGSSGGSAFYLTGSIYEMIIYNTALTTTQRQQVEGYLAQKWGLQGSLPSSHPYASRTLPSSHPYRVIKP